MNHKLGINCVFGPYICVLNVVKKNTIRYADKVFVNVV